MKHVSFGTQVTLGVAIIAATIGYFSLPWKQASTVQRIDRNQPRQEVAHGEQEWKKDWQLVSDKTLGFAFYYPPDWHEETKLSPSSNIIRGFYKISTTQTYPDPNRPLDAWFSVGVIQNPQHRTLQQIFDDQFERCQKGGSELGCPSTESVKDWWNFTLNGFEAYRTGKRGVAEGLPTDSLYVNRGDYFLQFNGVYYSLKNTYSFTETLNRIFSTIAIDGSKAKQDSNPIYACEQDTDCSILDCPKTSDTGDCGDYRPYCEKITPKINKDQGYGGTGLPFCICEPGWCS